MAAFDPMPTSEVQVLVTVNGRTYKAVRVIEFSLGGLSEAVQEAIAVVGQVLPTTVTFTRQREVYDEDNDKDVTIIEGTLTSDVVPPSVPFSLREVDGDAVLAQDIKLIVPAAIFEQPAVAAYEMQLRN